MEHVDDATFKKIFALNLWRELHTNPTAAQIWVTFATVVASWLMCIILAYTIRYYKYFRAKDRRWVQIGVGVGSSLASAGYIVQLFQLWAILNGAQDHIADIFRRDVLCTWAIALLSGLYQFTCISFYSYRIWNMSGRRWWVVPILPLCLAGNTAMMLVTVTWGFRVPLIQISSVREFPTYFTTIARLGQIWSIVCFSTDAVVSISTIYFLTRGKNPVLPQATERNLVYRILLIILESMIFPIAMLTWLWVMSYRHDAHYGPMRIPLANLGYAFWFSILYSLLGRRKVRQLLDKRPIGKTRWTRSNTSTATGTGTGTGHSRSGVTDTTLTANDLEGGVKVTITKETDADPDQDHDHEPHRDVDAVDELDVEIGRTDRLPRVSYADSLSHSQSHAHSRQASFTNMTNPSLASASSETALRSLSVAAVPDNHNHTHNHNHREGRTSPTLPSPWAPRSISIKRSSYREPKDKDGFYELDQMPFGDKGRAPAGRDGTASTE